MVDFLLSKDATIMLHRHLVRALPDRGGKEWIYLHELPNGWNPDKGLAVVVGDDANTRNDTSYDRNLVRISVHASSHHAARKLGRNIHQYLLSPLGGFGLGIDRERSTAVIVGPDSLAGGYVATTSISCGTSKTQF